MAAAKFLTPDFKASRVHNALHRRGILGAAWSTMPRKKRDFRKRKMRTRLPIVLCSVVVVVILSQFGHSLKTSQEHQSISGAAVELVGVLDGEQKKVALLPADSPQQVGWHFIPKDERKGLELNSMTEGQRAATHELLRTVLSEMGYSKSTQIMELEKLLKELQDKHGGRGPIRDHLRYYLTFFGKPSTSAKWGLSFEGHHLSLNFVLKDDKLISSTPQFFATNPATVKSENAVDIALGTRLLRWEETLAFELVNTMSKSQLQTAVIAEKAPREIRAAGEAQPPQESPAGIAWKDLSSEQRKLLRRLVAEYVKAVPSDVASQRMNDIRDAGFGKIHFAWAGPLNPGVGHYYRVQGPTFLIEFVNTQPDADGNPANHIHCVWRDMRGDFAKPVGS